MSVLLLHLRRKHPFIETSSSLGSLIASVYLRPSILAMCTALDYAFSLHEVRVFNKKQETSLRRLLQQFKQLWKAPHQDKDMEMGH